jgi:putative toxin-antitoxin system antitoxin component (TIGR02293 family)
MPAVQPKPKTVPVAAGKVTITDFSQVYQSEPSARVALIRTGVPAQDAKRLLERLNVSQGPVLKSLNLSTATLNRKAGKAENLSPEDSERIVGMSKLIGQVETMVAQSGNPEGFDAAHWVANWLQTPVAALGGSRPVDYMDTMEGQGMVSTLLGQMQGGAYA